MTVVVHEISMKNTKKGIQLKKSASPLILSSFYSPIFFFPHRVHPIFPGKLLRVLTRTLKVSSPVQFIVIQRAVCVCVKQPEDLPYPPLVLPDLVRAEQLDAQCFELLEVERVAGHVDAKFFLHDCHEGFLLPSVVVHQLCQNHAFFTLRSTDCLSAYHHAGGSIAEERFYPLVAK